MPVSVAVPDATCEHDVVPVAHADTAIVHCRPVFPPLRLQESAAIRRIAEGHGADEGTGGGAGPGYRLISSPRKRAFLF